MSLPPQPINRLQTVLEALKEQLPDDITVLIGGIDALAAASAENRIVMEPLTRQLAGASMAGAIATRIETVRFHIWGETIADVEELEELLINAVMRATTRAVSGTGAWDFAAAGQHGVVAVQEIAFQIPVMRRTAGKTPLEFAPLAVELQV